MTDDQKTAERVAERYSAEDDREKRALIRSGGQCECTDQKCDMKHVGRCPTVVDPERRGPIDDRLGWQLHDKQGNDVLVCNPCHRSRHNYEKLPCT